MNQYIQLVQCLVSQNGPQDQKFVALCVPFQASVPQQKHELMIPSELLQVPQND